MRARALTALVEALPIALTILFLAYPTVSSQAFLAFNCVPFDGEPVGPWHNRTVLPDGAHNYYLGTDLGVFCYTEAGEQTTYSPEYQRVRSLASLAIALYPIGVPVAYAVLLFWCYGELRTGRPIATLARALRFLYREYVPRNLWQHRPAVGRRMLVRQAVAVRPLAQVAD